MQISFLGDNIFGIWRRAGRTPAGDRMDRGTGKTGGQFQAPKREEPPFRRREWLSSHPGDHGWLHRRPRPGIWLRVRGFCCDLRRSKATCKGVDYKPVPEAALMEGRYSGTYLRTNGGGLVAGLNAAALLSRKRPLASSMARAKSGHSSIGTSDCKILISPPLSLVRLVSTDLPFVYRTVTVACNQCGGKGRFQVWAFGDRCSLSGDNGRSRRTRSAKKGTGRRFRCPLLPSRNPLSEPSRLQVLA